jgi:galactokinase
MFSWVYNHVIGVPCGCGIMDQIASACGESNKLLAMVCQVSVVYYSQHSYLVRPAITQGER